MLPSSGGTVVQNFKNDKPSNSLAVNKKLRVLFHWGVITYLLLDLWVDFPNES